MHRDCFVVPLLATTASIVVASESEAISVRSAEAFDMMPSVALSIIIPVLNEAPLLAQALARVPQGVEVVVVDAGSRDASVAIAKPFCEGKGWKLVPATLDQPSIGRTVAAAMPYVTGETVLVLPVDCSLSAESLAAWGGARCGGFAKKYVPSPWLMNAYAKLQNTFRSRWRRHLVWTNGMFFPKETAIPTTGFLEDVQLSDFLRKEKGWAWIETPIEVSARRYYPRRVFQRIALNFSILFLYRAGLRDFTRLKRLYLWLR